MPRPILVLGTHNQKKQAEIAALLEALPAEFRSLRDFPDPLNVDETGTTFQENARLKATQQARHLKHWVLAEDSGLAVDALKGAPGVYSARFAGPDATDEQNNQLLIEKLQGIPWQKRDAHYVCHVCLADPQGNVRAENQDICRGRIREAPAGTGGFGYDPYFELREYHHTFAELGGLVKKQLSHRARAIRGMLPALQRLMTSGEWSVS